MTLSAIFYGAGYLTGLIAFVLMARSRRLLTDGVMALLVVAGTGGFFSPLSPGGYSVLHLKLAHGKVPRL
jgi:hypothetical protein